MPIGFILGQLSRGKVDLEKNAASLEANVGQLRHLLFEHKLLSPAAREVMTEVEDAARVILRHRYEMVLTSEDVEGFYNAVDRLKVTLDGSQSAVLPELMQGREAVQCARDLLIVVGLGEEGAPQRHWGICW